MVCVIPLSRPLPNILIDAKLDFGLGFRNIILPFSPSKDQKIQLEGDFNKYFDVYMPKEYETDLLYILTPELMAYLIDYGKGYNFEICEDKLFIYSHFFKTNPPSVKKTLQDILPIARFFQYQFVDNTYNYRDEKVLLTDGKSTTIASTGRRLKKNKMSSLVAGAAIIGAVSVVLFIMLVTADY